MTPIKIYQVNCFSKCRSYFISYLQSVTVIADDEQHAISLTKEWLKKEGRKFIYPEEKWRVRFIGEHKQQGVIDYHEDSDY
ncbi:MAG TPA: hypothetical protein VFM18_09315 [Methanosarcina sp.]|nr:hypothetical protein [Methanosarcina sp.]